MKPGNDITRGAFLMVSSSLIFCVMAALIRQASHIDSYKITLFRFMIGLGFLGTIALSGKIKLQFRSGRLLFFRGLIGGTAVFIYYFTISKLGLAKASVIGYTFPIFATFFSAIFLKEKVSLIKALAIIFAFVGIYLLTIENGSAAFELSIGKYELLAVLGAALGGTAIVIIKKLHDTDSSYAIFFAQCAIGFWLMIIPASVVETTINYSGIALLLAIGFTATIGQLLMTQAYHYLTVSTGGLLGMLTPVLSYTIGVTIFNEPISAYSLTGATIVITCCTIVLKLSNKQ